MVCGSWVGFPVPGARVLRRPSLVSGIALGVVVPAALPVVSIAPRVRVCGLVCAVGVSSAQAWAASRGDCAATLLTLGAYFLKILVMFKVMRL